MVIRTEHSPSDLISSVKDKGRSISLIIYSTFVNEDVYQFFFVATKQIIEFTDMEKNLSFLHICCC